MLGEKPSTAAREVAICLWASSNVGASTEKVAEKAARSDSTSRRADPETVTTCVSAILSQARARTKAERTRPAERNIPASRPNRAGRRVIGNYHFDAQSQALFNRRQRKGGCAPVTSAKTASV